jgi:hypothetical protein
MNPYNNNNLKYPLTETEMNLIDNVWEFMNNFRETKITRDKYRRHIFKTIRQKYQVDEFYNLENITEKLYWNLATKIKEIIDLQPNLHVKKDFDLNQVENKILRRNTKIKESNIKKTHIITKKGNLVYKYNYPDDLDLLVGSIIINRSIYETIMGNEEELFNIEIEPYNNIIEFDYSYPNLNTIKSFVNNKEKRINNIISMYYEDRKI